MRFPHLSGRAGVFYAYAVVGLFSDFQWAPVGRASPGIGLRCRCQSRCYGWEGHGLFRRHRGVTVIAV